MGSRKYLVRLFAILVVADIPVFYAIHAKYPGRVIIPMCIVAGVLSGIGLFKWNSNDPSQE